MDIRSILKDYHEICERRYNGDYDAVCIIADLHIAIELAKLTDRQRQILELTYIDDRCFGDGNGGQTELGKYLNIPQSSVNITLGRSFNRLEKVYDDWGDFNVDY